MTDLRNEIRERPDIFNHEALAKEVEKLSRHQQDLSKSVATLDVNTRNVMEEIIGEFERFDIILDDCITNRFTAKNLTELWVARDLLSENMEIRLTNLQEKVQERERKADEGLEIARAVSGDFSKALAKTTKELQTYLASRSWIESMKFWRTPEKLKKERLEEDLQLEVRAIDG